MDSTVDQWQKLKIWLETNYQSHLELLNPPAAEDAVRQAEQKLGYSLPGSLTALLKLNDGESNNSDGLFGTWRLMPVSEQVESYNELSGDDRFPGKEIHPFLVSGGGDYYCIELATGKVVEWWHEGGVDGVISDSLSDFLSRFNDALIDGNYLVVDGFRGLVDKNDL